MTEPAPNYTDFTDDALIGMLFTEADRLPRAAADEIIARGPQMVHPLTWLTMDPSTWQADFPAAWAPIHATYLLGAISGEDALLGLLTAAEHAESTDCDWVLSALPAIFGRLGARARPHLAERVRDPARGPLFRATMAECLAATTARESMREDAVFAELGALFLESNDETLKALVGGVLLDFRRDEYRDALLAYARQQADRRRDDDGGVLAYAPADVERAFAPDAGPVLHPYTDDWLAFYSPEEIAARQARWDEEDADFDDVDVELDEDEWEPEVIPQVVRLQPKIGRNDPCRCGSGKKYKRCCLERDAASAGVDALES